MSAVDAVDPHSGVQIAHPLPRLVTLSRQRFYPSPAFIHGDRGGGGRNNASSRVPLIGRTPSFEAVRVARLP